MNEGPTARDFKRWEHRVNRWIINLWGGVGTLMIGLLLYDVWLMQATALQAVIAIGYCILAASRIAVYTRANERLEQELKHDAR